MLGPYVPLGAEEETEERVLARPALSVAGGLACLVAVLGVMCLCAASIADSSHGGGKLAPLLRSLDDIAVAIPSDEVLEWIRGQAFNKETEHSLLEHPIVHAAEAGTMPLHAIKLVLLEEYSIEQSDLQSMAAALARFGHGKASRAFFLSSADGEKIGLNNLISMAKVMHMSESTLAEYQPSPAAHAYSAYLAQLSNYGGAAAIAAGFAVNFPTWGRMCGRIRDALLLPPYSMSEDDVAFFTFFADPIPRYDESATAVVAEGMANGETVESIRSSVELLQGYERMFWDTVWAKTLELTHGCGGRHTPASTTPPHKVLEWIRGQAFNMETERTLLEHPIVQAAEAGTMPLDAIRLVILEEYSIEQSDLQSMAAAMARFGGRSASRAFFLSSVDSENVGLQSLIAMAKAMNMSESALVAYQPMPGAHAYSAYLAQLSNYGGAGAIAAGFAVNFPTWGRMCGRIRDALLLAPYSMSSKDVEFFTFFSDPIPGYDQSAAAVIAEGMADDETAESIRSAVELLQGYERMFWDTVWAKSIELAHSQ